MAEPRIPREFASREKTQRFIYQPESMLPEPMPQPGWVFHWVATHVNGQAVPMNTSKKLRDGWVPCKLEDHPEFIAQGFHGNANGNIEIGGLMLCKMEVERAKSIKEYFDRQAKGQMESVDNAFMRQNDARMPLFAERKSSTTRGGSFGSGS